MNYPVTVKKWIRGGQPFTPDDRLVFFRMDLPIPPFRGLHISADPMISATLNGFIVVQQYNGKTEVVAWCDDAIVRPDEILGLVRMHEEQGWQTVK